MIHVCVVRFPDLRSRPIFDNTRLVLWLVFHGAKTITSSGPLPVDPGLLRVIRVTKTPLTKKGFLTNPSYPLTKIGHYNGGKPHIVGLARGLGPTSPTMVGIALDGLG